MYMSSTGLLPTRVADPFKKGMGTHVRGVSIFILHFELRLIASLLRQTDYATIEKACICGGDFIYLRFLKLSDYFQKSPAVLLQRRFPVQDQRNRRGRAFVHGEIDKEPLAVGRHGVLLLVNAR